MKALLLGLLLSVNAYAIYAPGDLVANMCWKDADDKSHCLKDEDGKTRILLYNAGWCGPCNTEMREMGKAKLKKDVVYYSLSCDGYHGAPDAKFLKEWDAKFKLSANGIKVLAAPKDCGKEFSKGAGIPNVAVIHGNQKLKAFKVSPGVPWILSHD